MDERVNAGDRIGVAANEQRMKTHDDAQLGMLDVLRHQTVNRAPSLHACQVGHCLDHIANGFEGHHAQFDKAKLKTLFRSNHQIFEALHIFRTEFGNLIKHFFVVVAVIEMRTVVKANAIERRHQAQVDMVFHVFAAQRKKLGNKVRQGNDGWACIKGEAILLVHIGTTTWCVEFFKHLNAVAFHAQTNGCGQTTKSCTNHNGCRCTSSKLSAEVHGMVLTTTATYWPAIGVN